MRYLGKRRVGLCPHLDLPRNNVCAHDTTWVLMGANQGQDLWLEASMHPRGFEKREQPLEANIKTQSIPQSRRIGSTIWGELRRRPGLSR